IPRLPACAKMNVPMDGWEGRRRVRPVRSSFRTIAFLTLIPVFALLGLLIWSFLAQTIRLPAPPPSRHVAQAQVIAPLPLRRGRIRSEEHTSELQSRFDLVCRLLLDKKKTAHIQTRGI